MPRFKWHHFGIILRIANVQNVKQRVTKNREKQSLVMKNQLRANGKIKITWNAIACFKDNGEFQDRNSRYSLKLSLGWLNRT